MDPSKNFALKRQRQRPVTGANISARSARCSARAFSLASWWTKPGTGRFQQPSAAFTDHHILRQLPMGFIWTLSKPTSSAWMRKFRAKVLQESEWPSERLNRMENRAPEVVSEGLCPRLGCADARGRLPSMSSSHAGLPQSEGQVIDSAGLESTCSYRLGQQLCLVEAQKQRRAEAPAPQAASSQRLARDTPEHPSISVAHIVLRSTGACHTFTQVTQLQGTACPCERLLIRHLQGAKDIRHAGQGMAWAW